MKPKSVAILAAATAIVAVAAVYSVLSQRTITRITSDREYVFPDLKAKVNDVAVMKVTSASQSFTIQRSDDGWGMKEKGGYRVSFEKVKSSIVALAELQLLESKTSDPERYERLDLRDPTTKEAKSKRVELLDTSGKIVAKGLIGRQNASLFGGSGGGTYLRRGDDKQSWLASGTVQIGATPNDWMVRDIANIDAENVKRVVIRQPDGAELVIHKTDKKQQKFTVDKVPAGRKLKSDNEGKEVAGGLWRLTLEDVRPATTVVFPKSFHKASYTTFGGLTVNVEVTVKGEDYWGRFSASAEGATGDDKAKEAVVKKTKEINDRVTGWHYRLSIGEGERLTSKMKDLLEAAAKS